MKRRPSAPNDALRGCYCTPVFQTSFASPNFAPTKACPRGLRHGFGVRVAMKTRNLCLVQQMLGHTSLDTTAIYLDVVGQEARDEMVLTW